MEGIYCGQPPLRSELWSSWNFDPVVILALLVLTYVVRREPAGIAAVAIMIVVFISPLCALSSALFSARVLHHVLLVAVAAPLLALAFRTSGKPFSTINSNGLVVPLVASTMVLWMWHLPQAYDFALSNIAVYWVMQISLLGSALWFWRAVFAADKAPVERIVYVIVNFAQMGLLGALLTFAMTPLYAIHAIAPYDWGLTPLQDQQLGGLIMWVPAGLPYAAAAVLLARRSFLHLSKEAT